MKNMVWFVVLLYNSKFVPLSKLLRLFAGYNVVLVDNSPLENRIDEKELKKVLPTACVLRQDRNLGYAAGMNQGIVYALKHKAEWVVLVNDDITISQSSVQSFAKSLEKTSPSIAGPYPGSLDENRWTTILPADNRGLSPDYLSGSFVAIHRAVVEKIGFLYEPYFMYYEDAEYCVRAKRAGFPLLHIPVAGITHPKKKKDGRELFDELYYLARNHLLFVLRNAPNKVKMYEFARMPKSLTESYMNGELGSIYGIKDFALRSFGKLKGNI
jgi:GT2 family glycosyltransferase